MPVLIPVSYTHLDVYKRQTICTANVHLLSWNRKILTSFHAPYRDSKYRFAKLMMKKDCFSFHALTPHTLPFLPKMEWKIFFAPYRERKLRIVKLKMKIVSSFTPYKDSNHRFDDLFSKKVSIFFPRTI